MISYCDMEDWEIHFHHLPTPRGMCSVFNGPNYKTLKKETVLDPYLWKAFDMKDSVRTIDLYLWLAKKISFYFCHRTLVCF